VCKCPDPRVLCGGAAGSRSQEAAAAAPEGLATPAAEAVVAESAYGAAAATSSLPSSEIPTSVPSPADSTNGSGGAVEAGGPADTQQAAYDRMQQLLAAANPDAQPLQDPAARTADCLTPSPGKMLMCLQYC
jgi:hypothetical protein